MFLSKAALTTLFFSLLANPISAFPISEEIGLDKRLATQKLITELKLSTGKKHVTLDGEHETESYRRGKDLAPWTALEIPLVMEKWKEDTSQMHGPWISHPGKAEMIQTWTTADDPLKMECKYSLWYVSWYSTDKLC